MIDYIATSDDVRSLPEYPCKYCTVYFNAYLLGCDKDGDYCFDIPFIYSTMLHYCFPSNLPAYCVGTLYAQCDVCVEAGCSTKSTYVAIGVHPVGVDSIIGSGTGSVYISASSTLISSPW